MWVNYTVFYLLRHYNGDMQSDVLIDLGVHKPGGTYLQKYYTTVKYPRQSGVHLFSSEDFYDCEHSKQNRGHICKVGHKSLHGQFMEVLLLFYGTIPHE